MANQITVGSRYQIKSFGYEDSDSKRLIFTLIEENVPGEIRLYADEIAKNKEWIKCFAVTDVAIILYALEGDNSLASYKAAQVLLSCANS